MIKEIRQQMLARPRLGTPAAELTQSEQVAIAFSAAVPFAIKFVEGGLAVESLVPFAIVGRGDGTYRVIHLIHRGCIGANDPRYLVAGQPSLRLSKFECSLDMAMKHRGLYKIDNKQRRNVRPGSSTR